MKLKHSLQHLQNPTNGSYPEADEINSHLHTLLL